MRNPNLHQQRDEDDDEEDGVNFHSARKFLLEGNFPVR
jgi:hypothetical protein